MCSHPRIDETYEEGAKRRLKEELGIDAEITPKFHFIYKAYVGGNLWEHELDHVFTGEYNGSFNLNQEEVSEVRFVSMEQLNREVEDNPDHFTAVSYTHLDVYKRQNLYRSDQQSIRRPFLLHAPLNSTRKRVYDQWCTGHML